MKNEERRDYIFNELKNASGPITATSLARQLSVSRQIIVGDVALLRASGTEIIATPKGYILCEDSLSNRFGFIGLLACKHNLDQMLTELTAIITNGGTVIDVLVDHSFYGQLQGQLNLSSLSDVDHFVEQMQGQQPLSGLTGGVHLHHIGCESEEVFENIKAELKKEGIAL